MRRCRTLLCFGLPLLIIHACSRGSAPELPMVELPLVETIGEATLFPLNPVLDLRSSGDEAPPPGLALVLDSGWSHPESWGTWAIGEESTLEARLLSPELRFLTFECRPYQRFAHEPQQAVTVRVNGTDIGTVVLEDDWQAYRMPLPDGLLRAGSNRIVLVHRYHHSPRELGRGNDTRRLASGFRRLSLVDSDRSIYLEKQPLRLDPQHQVLRLALPGALVVPLQLPEEGSRLSFGVVAEATEPDPGPVHLALSLVEPGGKRSDLLSTAVVPTEEGRPEPAAAVTDRVVDLPGSGLCLMIIDARFTAGRARLRLQRPRLQVPGSGSDGESDRHEPRPVATASLAALPDMVLVTLDAARADHFGCYGYGRATTPQIDRLAAESLVFGNVIAHASYTTCSVPTMLTGLPFPRHGVVHHDQRISEQVTTLAEYLREAGYRTACLTANPHHSSRRGLAQGCDELIETWRHFGRFGRQSMDPHVLTELALAQLTGSDDRPSLLVLHYLPPHAPYTPPERFDIFGDPTYRGVFDGGFEAHAAFDRGELTVDAADQARLMSLYDGNLLRADDAVGQLLAALRARSRWSRTVVVVTSDHGEAFWEHSHQGHTKTVYDEMLRVPLILRLPPGQALGDGVDLQRSASLADLVPTLLALAGVTPAPEVTGRDLLASSDGQTAHEPWVLSRTGGRRPTFSLTCGRFKAVARGIHLRQLYDLRDDPLERHDLAGERPLLLAGFTHLIRQSLDHEPIAGDRTAPAAPDQEEEAALRALGYL